MGGVSPPSVVELSLDEFSITEVERAGRIKGAPSKGTWRSFLKEATKPWSLAFPASRLLAREIFFFFLVIVMKFGSFSWAASINLNHNSYFLGRIYNRLA